MKELSAYSELLTHRPALRVSNFARRAPAWRGHDASASGYSARSEHCLLTFPSVRRAACDHDHVHVAARAKVPKSSR